MRLATVAFGVIVLAASLIISPAVPRAEERANIGGIESEIKELKKENAELTKRVEGLENEDEEVKNTFSHLAKLVDVSGYADVEFHLTDQKGENNKFRLHHLSLFFTKDVQKDWKLFSEVEFEDAPDITSNNGSNTLASSQGTIFVEQMYIQYHPGINWDLRFGRVLTPAGIWSVYHYTPYVPTQSAPMMYKVIFPMVSDGALLTNHFTVNEINLDTQFYAGNGSDNSGSGDRNQNKGLGGRLNVELNRDLSGGLSYYRERDNGDVMKDSYGAHLLYNYGEMKFQTEYQMRNNAPNNASRYYDRGFYAQLSYDIGKWTAALRYDWYDPSDKASNDAYHRYTGAINYHFAHNVVGKIEYNRNEFADPAAKDYNQIITSVAIAFGDL